MPLVGTWIEIPRRKYNRRWSEVVPLVGTWIEIQDHRHKQHGCKSCPSWARGLKFKKNGSVTVTWVVPLVGTWIEIEKHASLK